MPHIQRCDNVYDCRDFSDEQNCFNSGTIKMHAPINPEYYTYIYSIYLIDKRKHEPQFDAMRFLPILGL